MKSMNHINSRVLIDPPKDDKLIEVWYEFLCNRFRAIVKVFFKY